MKNLEKLGVAKFKISTPTVASSDIELNFNPIIEQFKLSGNYILIHSSAKPKGYREWGIYSSSDDSYQSIAELSQCVGGFKSLQLDDATAKTLPTAVLYSGKDKITIIDRKAILGHVTIDQLIP